MLKIEELFAQAREKGASDIHIASGRAPVVRLHGELTYLNDNDDVVSNSHDMLFAMLTSEQSEFFKQSLDLDFAYTSTDNYRYRGNLFMQYRGGVNGVFRLIPDTIPELHDLGLPPAVKNFTDLHQGLVLVTGPMGSGKTTTLASMVNLINRNRADHILTIEDPIEYIHKNLRGVVNQREVRIHTKSYTAALRSALREDPDVIMVGELRDLETISLALTAAETGHLVFGTLHTTDAVGTVNRIIDVFPPGEQNKVRIMLAESLKGVLSQQLIPRSDKQGMVVAAELLINTSALANMIRDNKTFQIPSIIQSGKAKSGMCMMDDSIMDLLKNGVISPQKAYAFAQDKTQFRQFLKEENNG
ncbi:MAG: type IV pilus twitching motility protein PilT [Candidatus Auribacter fodinae]|jgi:twitching motility protein PilT|uniref:Type IV pilus twitching motility protein PilT n=1 Tax=Candidatus Auribacter fodinae TaxID=2093366 RepID=A0A3A4RFK0_9BACT|nr:MAG: type IV pilus twitching motility protein PilT [Candidatus Auribacter fodinae]